MDLPTRGEILRDIPDDIEINEKDVRETIDALLCLYLSAKEDKDTDETAAAIYRGLAVLIPSFIKAFIKALNNDKGGNTKWYQ